MQSPGRGSGAARFALPHAAATLPAPPDPPGCHRETQRYIIRNLDTGLEMRVDDFERLTNMDDEVRSESGCSAHAGTCSASAARPCLEHAKHGGLVGRREA